MIIATGSNIWAAPSCKSLMTLISQSGSKSAPDTINLSGFIKESSQRLSETSVRYSDLSAEQAASYTKGLVNTFRHYLYKSREEKQPRFTDPFSFIYSMKTEQKLSSDRYYAKILVFFDLFLKGNSSKNLSERISAWIQSSHDAALVYDVLYQSRILEFHPEILTELVSSNSFFKDAQLVQLNGHTSLISFSFEKESNSISIVNYFRTSEYSEAEWFKLSLESRYVIMQDSLAKSGSQASETVAWSVVPNSRTPDFISRPFLEDRGSSQERARWEVNHKLFTLSVDQLHQNITDVNKMADKKSDSVHLHIVFSLEKTYQFFNQFREWYKALSDYSVMLSMEEGLHSSHLTSLPALGDIVKNLSSLTGWTQKFFTIGLRSGDVYSDNPESPLRRIGLELRDITYNMDTLKAITKNISEQIQKRSWEKKATDENDPKNKVFRIEYNQEKDLALLSNYIHPEAALRLYGTDKNVILPLRQFEKETFFDYKTATYKKLTPEQSLQVKAARTRFISELKNLEKEYFHYKETEDSYDFGAFKAAIRWNLTEWAKQVRLSKVFSPF